MASSTRSPSSASNKLDPRLRIAFTVPHQTLVDWLRRSGAPPAHRFVGAPSTAMPDLEKLLRPIAQQPAFPSRPAFIPAFHGLSLWNDTVYATVMAAFDGDPSAFSSPNLDITPIAGGIAVVEGPLDDVFALAAHPSVLSMGLDEALYAQLNDSVADILGSESPRTSNVRGGAGVTIAVCDVDRLDFHHPDFTHSDGKTRLHCLAELQSIPPADGGAPRTIMTEFDTNALNADLESGKPFERVPLAPDIATNEVLHGTHVAAIATGNGQASKGHFAGVAPEAHLIYVSLGVARYGSGGGLARATRFAFERAQTPGCVVNLSVGTPMGPRDGSSELEQSLDALVEGYRGRAIVVAAGNEGMSPKMTAGHTENNWVDLPIRIPMDTRVEERIDIYCNDVDDIRISLLNPLAEQAGMVEPNQALPVIGGTIVQMEVQGRSNGASYGTCLLMPAASGGQMMGGHWRLRIERATGPIGRYRAAISRNTEIQFYDGKRASESRSHSLTSPSTARTVISVANYDVESQRAIAPTSSRGPTNDGRCKPDLAAPGTAIRSARAQWPQLSEHVDDRYAYMTGTSMAAPHVTGLIARMLELQNDLDIEEIRRLLVQAARPNGDESWNGDSGWGLARLPEDKRLCQAKPHWHMSLDGPVEVRTGQAFALRTCVMGPNPGERIVLVLEEPNDQQTVETNGRGDAYAGFHITFASPGIHHVKLLANDLLGRTLATASLHLRAY